MHQVEKTILAQIKKGHKKSFEILFNAYFKQLFNYAREILKDDAMAEEITEDAFVNLWEKKEKICIDTSLRAYLYKSIYNLCINHFKHEKVKDKYRLYFQHHISPEQYSMQEAYDYPLARVIQKELDNMLEKSIEKMPGQMKKIFLMSRYDKMKNKEIAEELEVSVNTVKTQLSRALVRLHEDLDEVLPLAPLSFVLPLL